MTKTTELSKRLQVLVPLFENDDIDAVIALGPALSSRRAGEIAFHKMRLAVQQVSAAKRHTSATWLADRGLRGLGGGDPFAELREGKVDDQD